MVAAPPEAATIASESPRVPQQIGLKPTASIALPRRWRRSDVVKYVLPTWVSVPVMNQPGFIRQGLTTKDTEKGGEWLFAFLRDLRELRVKPRSVAFQFCLNPVESRFKWEERGGARPWTITVALERRQSTIWGCLAASASGSAPSRKTDPVP